jgi:hypothetical protein
MLRPTGGCCAKKEKVEFLLLTLLVHKTKISPEKVYKLITVLRNLGVYKCVVCSLKVSQRRRVVIVDPRDHFK